MVNKGAFDVFTLAHIASGVFARRAGWSRDSLLLGAILFEVAEQEAKRRWPGVFPNPSPDTLLNQTSDVLAACVGWEMGK